MTRRSSNSSMRHMKTTLLLAAAVLAAPAAQAQSVDRIARYSDYTVALSSMPCPASDWAKTAVYNSYGSDSGRAYGCWTDGAAKVSIRWFKVDTGRQLPDAVPAKDFQSAN